MKNINSNNVLALYMIKNNTKTVNICQLNKFLNNLKILLKGKNYRFVKTSLNTELYELKYGQICCKPNLKIEDLETNLLLNLNLDVMIDCYVALGMFDLKTGKFTQK